jgi:hypothetical protein
MGLNYFSGKRKLLSPEGILVFDNWLESFRKINILKRFLHFSGW